MTPSGRRRFACALGPALLVALLAALVVSTVGFASTAAKPKSCSISSVAHKLGPTTVSSLRVTNVTCASGIAIVKAFHKCRTAQGKTGRCVKLVRGYACKEARQNGPAQITGAVTCRKGKSSVSHRYVQTLPRTLHELAYANASPLQHLDLYLPARAAKPAPLVIWVHGGGWRTGDKSAIAAGYDPSAPPPKPASCTDIVEVQVPDVRALNRKGYAVASINYRLDSNPVTALKDAKAAVRFLRVRASNYELDPQRFAAWGNSAGGYTVIMLGVTSGRHPVFDDPALGKPNVSSAVQAVVDWFGPTDAESMPGNVGAAESPYTYIAAGQSLPPFSIAHGDADCIVPAQQSRHLQQALTSADGTATLTILPGAYHEDPAFMRTQLTPTVAFLDRTFGIG